MDSGVVVTLILGVGLLFSWPAYTRAMRQMRQGDEEWRARWRDLDEQRKRQIIRTMRRGQPLLDPDDAELGSRAFRQIEHVRSSLRPLERSGTIMLIGLLLAAILTAQPVLAAIAGAGLTVTWVFGVVSWWRQRRYRRSIETTRGVMGP